MFFPSETISYLDSSGLLCQDDMNLRNSLDDPGYRRAFQAKEKEFEARDAASLMDTLA